MERCCTVSQLCALGALACFWQLFLPTYGTKKGQDKKKKMHEAYGEREIGKMNLSLSVLSHLLKKKLPLARTGQINFTFSKNKRISKMTLSVASVTLEIFWSHDFFFCSFDNHPIRG